MRSRRVGRLALPAFAILLGLSGQTALSLDDKKVDVPGKIHRIIPKDRIPAIKHPKFVSAEEAEIPDDARIFGVRIGDEARAYDLNILNHFEIVNDDFGGKKVAVVW